MKKLSKFYRFINLIGRQLVAAVFTIILSAGILTVVASYWPQGPAGENPAGWLGQIFDLEKSSEDALVVKGAIKIGDTSTTGSAGMLRYNPTDKIVQYHDGVKWKEMEGDTSTINNVGTDGRLVFSGSADFPDLCYWSWGSTCYSKTVGGKTTGNYWIVGGDSSSIAYRNDDSVYTIARSKLDTRTCNKGGQLLDLRNVEKPSESSRPYYRKKYSCTETYNVSAVSNCIIQKASSCNQSCYNNYCSPVTKFGGGGCSPSVYTCYKSCNNSYAPECVRAYTATLSEMPECVNASSYQTGYYTYNNTTYNGVFTNTSNLAYTVDKLFNSSNRDYLCVTTSGISGTKNGDWYSGSSSNIQINYVYPPETISVSF